MSLSLSAITSTTAAGLPPAQHAESTNAEAQDLVVANVNLPEQVQERAKERELFLQDLHKFIDASIILKTINDLKHECYNRFYSLPYPNPRTLNCANSLPDYRTQRLSRVWRQCISYKDNLAHRLRFFLSKPQDCMSEPLPWEDPIPALIRVKEEVPARADSINKLQKQLLDMYSGIVGLNSTMSRYMFHTQPHHIVTALFEISLVNLPVVHGDITEFNSSEPIFILVRSSKKKQDEEKLELIIQGFQANYDGHDKYGFTCYTKEFYPLALAIELSANKIISEFSVLKHKSHSNMTESEQKSRNDLIGLMNFRTGHNPESAIKPMSDILVDYIQKERSSDKNDPLPGSNFIYGIWNEANVRKKHKNRVMEEIYKVTRLANDVGVIVKTYISLEPPSQPSQLIHYRQVFDYSNISHEIYEKYKISRNLWLFKDGFTVDANFP